MYALWQKQQNNKLKGKHNAELSTLNNKLVAQYMELAAQQGEFRKKHNRESQLQGQLEETQAKLIEATHRETMLKNKIELLKLSKEQAVREATAQATSMAVTLNTRNTYFPH